MSNATAHLLAYASQETDLKKIAAQLGPLYRQRVLSQLRSWQKKTSDPLENQFFQGIRGPLWWVPQKPRARSVSHQGRLEVSDHVWARETAGSIFQQAQGQKVKDLELWIWGGGEESVQGALVGLGMAAYRYHSSSPSTPISWSLRWNGKKVSSELQQPAQALSSAVNLCRHLVNLPPNLGQPEHLEAWIRGLLNPTKSGLRSVSQRKGASAARSGAVESFHFPRAATSLKLEIWDEKRLKKEKMGLHLGVGQGSASAPRLLILSYQPKGAEAKAPVALVGKGITFDTGGLDIKPSSAMRLMKKDMGGAAAVLATMFWAAETQLQLPLVAYVPLAENSVDGRSFRPSDVLEARSGMKVEIHNTDAEGRLVLADALDVAVTSSRKPRCVIDLATLTGAIKTALGTEIAGLFSNDDFLSEGLEKAAQKSGDLIWRMPLYSKYTASFSTPFADWVNAVDGWAGAITGALFLERFVRQTPWAHLDIYAWNDKASGSLAFAGGNGQGVQLLAEFLNTLVKRET